MQPAQGNRDKGLTLTQGQGLSMCGMSATKHATRTAVSANGLRKAYGEKVVLDSVDLSIGEGEVFALLGPNGAGKTTTVQILSTLIPADAGTASVMGHDLRGEAGAVRAVIGVTGQFSAVDDLLTGEENLLLKRDAIGDPEFCAIYLDYDAAFDWSPDDPRLPALADRAQRWIANRQSRLQGRERPVQDPAIAQLVATSPGASSPAWDRLTQIAKRPAHPPGQT
jgi:ABC-type cobalamin/Fe3+-siderophores transport system ATPase subunit